MRAGRLRHRVTIQSQAQTAGADGAVVVTWATAAVVWARITPIDSRESIFAGQTMSEDVAVEIMVRLASFVSLSPAHRFVTEDGTTAYEIESIVEDDEREHSYRCACRRRAL